MSELARLSDKIKFGKIEQPLFCGLLFLASFFTIKYYLNFFWMEMDDGFYAESAHRINLGQIPHKDFHDFHPGLIQYTHALAFKLFGETITSLRYPLLIVGSLMTVFSYLSFRSHGRVQALVGALIAFSFGVIIIMNPSSNWYATACALAVIYILSDQKADQSRKLQILMGCIIGICFLYRSLNGGLLGIGCLVYLYGQQKDAGGFREFLSARIILVLTFLVTGAFLVMKSNSYSFAVMGIPALAVTVFLILKVRCNTKNAFALIFNLLAGVVIAMLPLLFYYASQGNILNWVRDVFILPMSLLNLDYVNEPEFYWLMRHAMSAVPEVRSPFQLINLMGWGLMVTLPLSMVGLIFLGRFTKKMTDADWWLPAAIIGIYYMVATIHFEVNLYLVWGALPALLGFYALCLKLPLLWRNILVLGMVAMCITSLMSNVSYPIWRKDTHDILLGKTPEINLIPLAGSTETMVLAKNSQRYVDLISFIDREVPKDGTIFVYPANPDITFLSKRRDPTSHPMPGVSINSDESLEEVTQLFRTSPPDIIVNVKTRRYKHPLHMQLDSFIRHNFRVTKETPHYILYVPLKKDL